MKLTKKNVPYRLLHDVTNRHLNPIAQDAMTVSLAAQVMSSTVTAAINTQVTAGHMDNRCFTAALFVEEDNDLFARFSGVMCYPDHGKLVHWCLASTSKHMERWRSAVGKVQIGPSSAMNLNQCAPSLHTLGG